MGPESPTYLQDFSASSQSEDRETASTSIIEIDCDDKAVIQQLVQDPNAKPLSANTPRDYSELSSLATDSIAVYVEPNDANNENVNPPKSKDISANIRNPIQKLSSLFTKTPKNIDTGVSANVQAPDHPLLNPQNVDLYRINILQPKSEAAPKRVVFDLVDDLQPCTTTVATNTSPRSRKRRREAQLLYRNEKCNDNFQQCVPSLHLNSTHMRSEPVIDASVRMQKKTIYHRTSATNKLPAGAGQLDSVTRVDVYYFDHGNSAYYHTTDCPPVIMTEILAEKTENYTTKFWAETFGFVHIIFSFITSFILQLLRSVLQSFVRPLTVGVLQIFSDYCIKPLLATTFNALVQPPLIFLYNVATTLRDICDPVAEGLGYFMREIAAIFASIRFVDVKYCRDAKQKKKLTYDSNADDVDVERN